MKRTNAKKTTTGVHSANLGLIPAVLHEALTVLAELDGMTLKDLFIKLGHDELERRGLKLKATGDQIAAAIEERRKKGHVEL